MTQRLITMSVVLDRPFTRTRTPQSDAPVALRHKIGPEPEYQPYVDIPVQVPVRVRRRSGTDVLQVAVTKTLLFSGVFALTYLSSALYGNYMVDKSSKLSHDASIRANAALQAKDDVQKKINVLTSDAAIKQWALSHSFQQAEQVDQTSRANNLVTSNQ